MTAPLSHGTGVGGVGRLRWVRLGAWQMWTRPRHVIGYVLAVDALAVSLVAAALSQTPLAGYEPLCFLALLAAGMLYIEVSRGIERIRREYQNTPHVDLHSVWFFAAALLLPPGWAALVVAVVITQRWFRVRYHAPHRRVFSAATTMVAIRAASGLLGLLDFDADARTVANFAVVVAAGLLYQVTSFLPIAGAIALTTSGPDRRKALGVPRDHALEAATIGLGLLLAWALLDWPIAGIVIVGITLVLHSTVLIRQLQDRARSDPKTGLLNNTGFAEIAQREIDRTARHSGQYLALLVLDIDHFKTINDRYGHPAGDAVLHADARSISGEVRAYDLVGGYGGDELVILLPDTTATEATHVAERIRARIQALAIQAPTHLGTERLTSVTASIGVAVYPTDGATVDAVVQAADRACYSAKHAGRNRVMVHRSILAPDGAAATTLPIQRDRRLER